MLLYLYSFFQRKDISHNNNFVSEACTEHEIKEMLESTVDGLDEYVTF